MITEDDTHSYEIAIVEMCNNNEVYCNAYFAEVRFDKKIKVEQCKLSCSDVCNDIIT